MASLRAVRLGLALGAVLLGPALGASARGQCAPGADAGGEACSAPGVDDETSAMLQHPRPRNKGPEVRSPNRSAAVPLKNLAGHVASAYSGGGSAGSARSANAPECLIDSTNDCPIGSLPTKQWQVINPTGEGSPYDVDGDMKCIDGSPYKWKFWRGSSSQLLIYLQGGGACWNKWSTQGIAALGVPPLCTTSVEQTLYFDSGPLNMSNGGNPFQYHSVLYLPYCSGDGFAGDKVQPYSLEPGLHKPKAIQKGYRHVLAALTWLQGNSEFSQQTTLEDFTVQGCSAGTIGTQVWANSLLGRFSYNKSRVVLDSYAGIFPLDSQKKVLAAWGVCDLPVLTPGEQAFCKNPEGLFTTNLTGTALGSFPTSRFVTINSKIDEVQRYFYTMTKYDTQLQLIGAFLAQGPAAFAPLENTTFYQILNEEVLQAYGAYDNWQGFIVEGVPHCFNLDDFSLDAGIETGSFYSGPLGDAPDTGTPQIPEDLTAVYVTNPPRYVCDGEDLDPSEPGGSVSYCDARLRG